MKITHVTLAMSKGGAERVIVDLANAEVTAGHDVTVVLAFPLDSRILRDDLDSRIKVHFVSKRRSRLGNYSALPGWITRNRHWLFEQDVVHCHLTFGGVFGSLLQMARTIRRAASPKVIETYHATGTREGYAKRAFHRLLLMSRDAVALVALDEYWSDFARARRHRRVELIPNGISDPSTRKLRDDRLWSRTALGISSEAFVIGSISRLAKERAPERFIEVFANFTELCAMDSHLLLAGDGPERSKLEKMVFDRHLQGRVSFVGEIRSPAEFFSLIDLYLSLSVRNLTGIAGLEAAFSGVPMVSMQADLAYQTQPTDWFWSSPNLFEVASEIADLARRPQARSRLSGIQRAHARSHYSLKKMANSYLRLYGALVELDSRGDQFQ